MKPKPKTVLTHGAALLAGAAIAVAVSYNPSSHAQAQPAAAPVAERHNAPPSAPVTVIRAAGSAADEDSAANAFDQITARAIDTRPEPRARR